MFFNVLKGVIYVFYVTFVNLDKDMTSKFLIIMLKQKKSDLMNHTIS